MIHNGSAVDSMHAHTAYTSTHAVYSCCVGDESTCDQINTPTIDANTHRSGLK